jgi:hexokinase
MFEDQLRKYIEADTAVLPTVYTGMDLPLYNEEKSNLPILSSLNLKTIQLNFLSELKSGMRGKKTSLPFILHSLSSTPLINDREVFQVMVMGGSVFKKARAVKNKKGVVLSRAEKEQLPIMRTKKDFISFVERHIDLGVTVVGLNFAYPLGPVFEDGKLDGALLSGTKEHSFGGVVGERVGKMLEEHFMRKYKRKISFAVANDTVCLLLSGLEKASWENLACGIVGTGVNFAFFIRQNDLVNLESANFNRFPLSDEAKEIDLQSAHQGRALFEKETSGAYLYQHFNSIVTKQKLGYKQLSSTYELKMLALRDKSLASTLARGLIKKSAALVATQIGGITLLKNHDMTFVMDGSFFWEEDIYRNYVEDYLRILIPNRRVVFASVDDSPLVGAAKLVS